MSPASPSEATRREPAAPAPTGGAPPERVLSTLNADGTRRWLFPRVSKGRFLTGRRIVAYALLVLYNVLPWIPVNGKPSILLDLPRREFTFFGTTFLPTDTLLLMLFVAGVFVTVFLVTALFGRLWCGWACPQTVYMEFVYRPIERLFDGDPDARRRGRAAPPAWRTILKYAVFLVISLHLAHTFLAYFVGVEDLLQWTRQSPFEHPTSFLIVVALTGLMMFDFAFFREQTCIVACPYGRFQSVMLDRHSLIIGYDSARGEPRGKLRRKAGGDASPPQRGDCIDCQLCVVTCPTGIDIRDGLQMECIGCAQCIDACDAVMDKIDRPRGLIRYSSQAAMEQRRLRLLRPRVVLYPLLLAVIIAGFLVALTGRATADVTLLRPVDLPYVRLADGRIANRLEIKIVNRAAEPRRYTFEVRGIEGAELRATGGGEALDPGATATIDASIVTSDECFETGRASIEVIVADDAGFSTAQRYRLQGPWGSAGADEGGDGGRAGEEDEP